MLNRKVTVIIAIYHYHKRNVVVPVINRLPRCQLGIRKDVENAATQPEHSENLEITTQLAELLRNLNSIKSLYVLKYSHLALNRFSINVNCVQK